MGTLGNQPNFGAYGFTRTQAESFNGTGSATSFTLGHHVKNAIDIEVLVDNVQQSPFDGSYSVSGTTLTFSGAPASGTNNVYVMYRQVGTVIDTQALVPDDSSVTDAKIVGMSSSKLSGALPALDGSSLTGIQLLSGGIPQKITSSTSAVTFTGIPSTARIIYLSWYNVLAPAQFYIRLRVGGSTITSGYSSSLTYRYATTSNSYTTAGGSKYTTAALQWGSWGATSPFNGFATIARNDAVTDTDYSYSFSGTTQYESYSTHGGIGQGVGRYDASAVVDGIEFSGNSNLTSGTFNVWYQ